MVIAYAGCLLAARALDAAPRWRPIAPGQAEESPGDDAEEDETRPASGDSVAKLGALITVSGTVILVAGFLLSRSGESIAEQSGLGQSFFGAVFLAGATSLPELSSAVAAVRLGKPQLAIGDIMGGNLFKLSLLLLVDVLYRQGPVFSEAGDFEVVAAMLGSVICALYVIGLVERRNRTVLRMGWDSAAVLVVYAAGLVILFGLRGAAAD